MDAASRGRSVAIALLLLAGCGAKTGLDVPEPTEEPPDPPPVGPADAAPPPPPSGCLGRESVAIELLSYDDDGVGDSWAIVVTNPNDAETEVTLESAEPGGGVTVTRRARLAAQETRSFELPREVVSLERSCTPDEECGAGLECACRATGRCRCVADLSRESLPRRAVRVSSELPVMVMQTNPARTEGAFSYDSTLLFPSTSWGERYRVVGWPQTFGADGDPPRTASTLTVVAGAAARVRIRTPASAGRTLVTGGGALDAGETLEVELSELEAIELFTDALGADLSGATVESSGPVAAFVGAELGRGSVTDPACCADHLETQLVAGRALGRRYLVPALPNRVAALNRAIGREAIPPSPDPVIVVLVADEDLTVRGAPGGPIRMARGERRELRTEVPMVLDADGPLAVLVGLGGQVAAGVPTTLPGGDPSISVLPPASTPGVYTPYVPPGFAFDYLVLSTTSSAEPRLDGRPASERCEETRSGSLRQYTCALSSPTIRESGSAFIVEPGTQRDGVHRVEAPGESSLMVYGFDRFISHVYPGCDAPSAAP